MENWRRDLDWANQLNMFFFCFFLSRYDSHFPHKPLPTAPLDHTSSPFTSSNCVCSLSHLSSLHTAPATVSMTDTIFGSSPITPLAVKDHLGPSEIKLCSGGQRRVKPQSPMPSSPYDPVAALCPI